MIQIKQYLRNSAGRYYTFSGTVGTTTIETEITRIYPGAYSQNDLEETPGVIPMVFTDDARLIVKEVNRAFVDDDVTPDVILWMTTTITGASSETPLVQTKELGQLLFETFTDDEPNLKCTVSLQVTGGAAS